MAFAGNQPEESRAATPTPTPKARLTAVVPGQQNEGTSESGKISFELRGEEVGEREIWLYPKDHTDAAVKLCDTEGWCCLKMHFSTDDHWLIVEDGGASLGVSLRLFRRDKGVNFTEIKKPDITEKAIELALRDAKPAGAELLHAYLECVAWSSDSRRILVELTGNVSAAGQRLNIEWAAVYDVRSGTFSRNLAEFNRDVLWRSK
jgi:hypothetical protein